MFDLFSELFSPGRKHTTEERKRLELSREDLGDSDPSRGPIDLSSGKVTLRLTGPTETAPADPTAGTERPDGPGRPGGGAGAPPDTPA
ncbi:MULTISPECIES: DUF6191 domain-containing protein [unclassified Streptomyces]|uniref:DUF6191 domain-containing protein n=1 Tax=unclassified Streptomyces TaxID=2593676 RepID=UPI000CD4F6D5|nr:MULTISPECIES: DUF6191 domain-containing protein [unclassified Streptomyces]AWL40746.1 hypothetical protein B9S64_23590 [Streptomyces sp. SM18]